MKRLVLLGEGHGEVSGLPVLARKLLHDQNAEDRVRVDYDVIRAHNAAGLVKWDKKRNCDDFSEWRKYLNYAARRKDVGGVLAVFDGDATTFPAGARSPFCAATAAQRMALAARDTGAGRTFSLAIVFACVEYETWLVAGAGHQPVAGKPVLFPGKAFPVGDPESHGKGWIERNLGSYRPTRDQKRLTELLDLDTVRAKGLRSFARLEHAFAQLLDAIDSGSHTSSPS